MCNECGYKHEGERVFVNGVEYDKYGNPKRAKKKKKKKEKK